MCVSVCVQTLGCECPARTCHQVLRQGPPGRCVAQSRDFLGAPPCPLSSACLGRRRAVTLCSRKHNWKLPAEPNRPDTSPKSVVNLGAAAPETPQLFPDRAAPRTAVFRRHRTERLCRRHAVSRADGPHLPPGHSARRAAAAACLHLPFNASDSGDNVPSL